MRENDKLFVVEAPRTTFPLRVVSVCLEELSVTERWSISALNAMKRAQGEDYDPLD